jgi:hypothetical protein
LARPGGSVDVVHAVSKARIRTRGKGHYHVLGFIGIAASRPTADGGRRRRFKSGTRNHLDLLLSG